MFLSALAHHRSFLTGGELEQISVIFTLPSPSQKLAKGIRNITYESRLVSRYGAAIAFNRYAWIAFQSQAQESICRAGSLSYTRLSLSPAPQLGEGFPNLPFCEVLAYSLRSPPSAYIS